MVYSVAFGGHEVALDLFALYRKRHQVLGLNTSAIDVVQSGKILSQLTPLFESGMLSKPHVAETYTLAEGAHAYERVGGARGKVVLRLP